ncbi:MAG: TIGR00725 family protein [Actinomycetota bacterium]
MTTYVAVCGPSSATDRESAWAEEVGRRLAEAGAVVVCGGLGGVMDAAARGATSAEGLSVGLLPGNTREGASPHLTAAIPTGMGEARNALVVRAADAVIAIGGEWGTLSEIALAVKMGKPVVGVATWDLTQLGRTGGPVPVTTPQEAVTRALDAAR